MRSFFNSQLRVGQISAARLMLMVPVVACLFTLLSPVSGEALGDVRKLDLDATTTLAAPISPRKMLASAFVQELSKVSGKGVVVLGRLPLNMDALQPLQGKPARSVMATMAKVLGGEWTEYRGFYLLSPASLERHSVQPLPMSNQFAELKRHIKGVFAGDLPDAVDEISRQAGVRLAVIAPGVSVSPMGQARSNLPCLVAVPEMQVDDLMSAFTAITGDAWEHYRGFHLLNATGRSCTPEELAQVDRQLAPSAFRRSLTPRQIAQLVTDVGLPASQLSTEQRRDLAIMFERGLTRSGLPVESLVLRRLSSGRGMFDPEVTVCGPSGGTYLGSIVLSW